MLSDDLNGREKLLNCVRLFETLMTVAYQAPPSMRFFQARVLEWDAISFSRGSAWPRDQTQVSCIAGRHFTSWATREARMGRKTKKEGTYVCMHAQSLSCVWLYVTPWTVAYQAPPSMRFSRQEYWSGLPLPSPKEYVRFSYTFLLSYYLP